MDLGTIEPVLAWWMSPRFFPPDLNRASQRSEASPLQAPRGRLQEGPGPPIPRTAAGK